ncbi:MAG: NosD domain-containing protein [Candidatus Thorarchaeota archaeon]
MQRKDRGQWIVAILAICLLVLPIMPYSVSYNPESEAASPIAGVSHDPFVIMGDANFSDTASAEGWSGDGSPGSPFIIENLDIVLGFTPIAAISITGTQVHFIIRSCSLTGPLATPSYGVHLENVANGQIDDTQCSGFSTGINITGCDSITVSNSNCSGNPDGIHIESSNSSTVVNNICSNTMFIGIRLLRSNSSIVSGNTCNDGDMNGIYLDNCNSTTANGNVCNNNNNYGLSVHTCNFSTVNRNTCDENAFSGIHLVRSYFSSAEDNICNENREGIYIQEMDSSNISGNACILNDFHGIVLEESDSNNLTFNILTNTTTYFGIYLDGASGSNEATWNVFVHNMINCIDDGQGNVFNYNYYSDYSGVDDDDDGIGETAYAFATTNSDPNPLMYYPYPPELAQIPVDQISEFGTFWSYTLEFIVTATTAPYYLSVKDSVNFTVGGLGYIANMFPLPVGIYPIEITATNIYGFITKSTFTLLVMDTTPPIITSPDDISYTKGEQLPQIHWTAQDLSLIGYIVLLDGSEVTSYGLISTSVSFQMTLEDKEPGLYNYTMVVEDEWGNVAFDTVMVTVHPVPLLEALRPFLIVGAVAIIVIVVAFVAFRKRRSS